MPESIIPVKPEWQSGARLDNAKYRQMYATSLENSDVFWTKEAENFLWRKRWYKVKDASFVPPVCIRWFDGAELNFSENCLDRHLDLYGDQTAILWQGDDPAESRALTYAELHGQVCRIANVLKNSGVKKGDRVTIYLPMIPEAAMAMLACARIGAVHSVVFAGFSAEALKGRIDDCGSVFIITADEGMRGGKRVALKNNVDAALKHQASVRGVLVYKRTGGEISFQEGRDRWWHEEMARADAHCEAESMGAEAPLFILYTSGSTGKPKGVLHTTAGYMVWVGTTSKYTFDARQGEVFWCTADIGWVTGHSYTLYAPLLNAGTTLMFEGVPNYPDASRFWAEVERHKVNIFHTAPTAIRALMREGDTWVKKHNLSSLRVLGSVGEPINPEAWRWYYETVGGSRCPIVDTWWQTETGGHMITPLAGVTDLKPGSATLPFFGVKPVICDTSGKILKGEAEGMLCIADSWPGQARSIYGDHARFEQTYFSTVLGMYFTGDGAKRDADGYYWITGRIDDVLNVSGHRLGTAEIESALVAHPAVAEAAVVGFPHDIKRQGIYAYVTLIEGKEPSAALEKELMQQVRRDIGPIATPDILHFTPELPKTRSGKIMRRILRKIAENDTGALGDTSTLTNPDIVQSLIGGRKTLA